MVEIPAMTFADLTREGILEVGDGHRAKLDELGGEGPYFLRAGALSASGFDWSGLDSFLPEVAERLGSKQGRPGDVVITTKGNSIGRVGWVPGSAPEFVYSPHLSYWRSLDERVLAPRFLYYWSRSEVFAQQLRRLAFGTDMAPYLSLRDQARLTIQLPAIGDQRAIAEVLGALDDKIAANTRLVTTASQLAEMRYCEAVNDRPTAPMSEVLEPVLGGTPSRAEDAYWGGPVPWASAKDVTTAVNGVILSTSESVTNLAAERTKVKPLPRGSVVLTARGTVGEVARLGVPAAINQSCYGFAPNGLPAAVLYFAVRAAAQQARALAHGSVFDTITMRTFRHLTIPNLDSSTKEAMQAEIGPLLDLAEAHLLESVVLAGARDELLPLLMSGKVRVKDAEKAVEGVV